MVTRKARGSRWFNRKESNFVLHQRQRKRGSFLLLLFSSTQRHRFIALSLVRTQVSTVPSNPSLFINFAFPYFFSRFCWLWLWLLLLVSFQLFHDFFDFRFFLGCIGVLISTLMNSFLTFHSNTSWCILHCIPFSRLNHFILRCKYG